MSFASLPRTGNAAHTRNPLETGARTRDGGLLPLLAVLLIPAPVKVAATFAIVLLALAFTGAAGARLGDSPPARASLRVVVGGGLALAATFAIGSLLGAPAG